IEKMCFVGMVTEIFESVHAEYFFSGGLGGLDAVREVVEGCEMKIGGTEEQHGADGVRGVGAHGVGEAVVPEDARAGFGEDSLTGEKAQEAIERVFVHAEGAGQIGGGAF